MEPNLSNPAVFHIEGLIRLTVSFLGIRKVFGSKILCVSKDFRRSCTKVYFNKEYCQSIFPSLNILHLTTELRTSMAPGPEGDVAKLLDIIRGTDSATEEKGWELFCRKVFLSEQEAQGSLLDFDFNWSEDEDYEEDAEDSDHDEAAFIERFAHEQTDDILFLIEMRCAKEEKKVVFAYGHNGAMWKSWRTRPTFGFEGNSYDKASRVVLDESHGVVFQNHTGSGCSWPDCQLLAKVFKCTVRAVMFVDDGYKLTTIVNNGNLTYYDVHGDGEACFKYQCVLPGIPDQVAGENDELFLRFEFDQTQNRCADGPYWKDDDDDVPPLTNVCWMHNMNLTFHKGSHARSTWNDATNEDSYNNDRDFNNDSRATAYDMLSSLSTMRWT